MSRRQTNQSHGINRTEWRRTWWRHADKSNEVTAYGSQSDVSVTRKANEKTSRGSSERDGSEHDGVIRMQSGVMAAMSRVASLNNNTTTVNSATRGSGPDNVLLYDEVTTTRHGRK